MQITYAEEYGGIGAWAKALLEAITQNNDTKTLLYYAEWDAKASNAYSAVHNISEDYNIWDTSIGYREFQFGGITRYGVYTCMFGNTHLYTEIKKNDSGQSYTYFNFNYIYDDLYSCISRVYDIRSKHKIFEIDEEGQFIVPAPYALLYSPPCQSYSIAGKREGINVDKGNLFYSTLIRIIKLQPSICMMENVKGLPSGDTKKDFYNMLTSLEDAGYHNDWKILNTKDYNIAQNRERVFIVSIRKDLYDNGMRFEFPQKIKLERSLKYFLEDEVDEKYFLSQKIIDGFIRTTNNSSNGYKFKPLDKEKDSKCLTAWYCQPSVSDNYIYDEVKQVGNLIDTKSFGGNPQVGRVYDPSGCSPTLSTMQGGGQEPKVIIEKVVCLNTIDDEGNQPSQQDRIYSTDGLMTAITSQLNGRFNIMVNSEENIKTKDTKVMIAASRGRYKEDGIINQELEINKENLCNTLTSVQKDNYVVKFGTYNGMTIRKLTPLECWRLQGFKDEDYYLAVLNYVLTYHKKLEKSFTFELIDIMKKIREDGLNESILPRIKWIVLMSKSDSQMYMRAGNSITVNVITEILLNLLYERKQPGQQLSLF